MTLLRCQRVPIERLQLATAEVAAFIPPEKTHLLREIYRVAREEERYRLGQIPSNSKVYVASSAEISPASDEGIPSPIYPEPVHAMSQSGASQLGIPQMQRPPSRPRSAQPSYSTEELQNNPFNTAPSKRQKTLSPQGPPSHHITNYPEPIYQHYYPFQLSGQHSAHTLTHSQSQLLYTTHGGPGLRYQLPEIKSAPPSQQSFYLLHPDFPSPPPSGGFHTTFPHDPPPQSASHAQPQTPTSTSAPHSFGAAYVAAQQLSSLRETTFLHNPSSNFVPEPQPTPQHASTSNPFLNQRSSPYLPTPLRAAGLSGQGSSGPNVSFSEYLNSPLTTGPVPASDGAAERIRRVGKRPAEDSDDSDDETVEGDNGSPQRKV